MLAVNEERFRRIYREYLESPGGDYAELLRRGEVGSPEGTDPEAWRAEIRRKARQDKVSVSTSCSGDRAFAMINKAIPREEEPEVMAREFHRYEALQNSAIEALCSATNSPSAYATTSNQSASAATAARAPLHLHRLSADRRRRGAHPGLSRAPTGRPHPRPLNNKRNASEPRRGIRLKENNRRAPCPRHVRPTTSAPERVRTSFAHQIRQGWVGAGNVGTCVCCDLQPIYAVSCRPIPPAAHALPSRQGGGRWFEPSIVHW
jgi:hypothetical protein